MEPLLSGVLIYELPSRVPGLVSSTGPLLASGAAGSRPVSPGMARLPALPLGGRGPFCDHRPRQSGFAFTRSPARVETGELISDASRYLPHGNHGRKVL